MLSQNIILAILWIIPYVGERKFSKNFLFFPKNLLNFPRNFPKTVSVYSYYIN